MELPLRGSKKGYAEQTQACVDEGERNINFAAERGRMVSDKSAIPPSRICEPLRYWANRFISHGRPLRQFDPRTEARLRCKIVRNSMRL